METVILMKECEEIIQKALAAGRSSLLISEARQICRLHNIPTPDSQVTESAEDAIEAAKKVGFPVALKIVSPQILHKSDVGGVILNVNDETALRAAYEKLLADVGKNMPQAKILGVLVGKMMPPSTEVIVGGIRDSQFGPSIMFGMGGIFAEVYKDVAFRVAPIDRLDALDLMHEIKGAKILQGIRGEPAADTEAIVAVLLNASALMMEHSSISQLDLNPVIAYPDGACAVDSRIVMAPVKGGE
jgi:acyl-CoA synthetase (NDP forming)